MSFTSQAPFNAEEVVQLKAENEQLKLEVKQLRLEAEQAKALELAKVRAHERALYKEYRSLVSTKLDDCFEVTRFKAIGFDHIFTDKTLLQVYNNFRAGWYGAHRETHIDPLLDDFEQKYTRYLKHFWTKLEREWPARYLEYKLHCLEEDSEALGQIVEMAKKVLTVEKSQWTN